jgi:Uma2 family endonuclease
MSVISETPQTGLMTADELLMMPNSRWGFELVRGKLKKYMPAGNLHGFIASRIGRILGNFVEETGLGAVFAAETGFQLFQNPDTVRAPDSAYVGNEKLAKYGLSKGYFPDAPDLAVEVVSPNDKKKDIEDKTADYLNAGVRLIWIVYPRNGIVAVYRQNNLVSILREGDDLDGEDVLPNFRLPLEKIFGNLPEVKED